MNKAWAYITFGSTIAMAISPFVIMYYLKLDFTASSGILIEPAAYAFAIFYLIYVGFIALGFHQSRSQQWYNPKFIQSRPYIIINTWFNVFWLIGAAADIPWIEMTGSLVVLYTLVRLSTIFEIGQSSKDKIEKYFIKLPIALYFGWITLLTPVSITLSLIGIFGSEEFLMVNSEIATVVILIASFLLVVFLFLRRKVNLTYILVVIWGLLGIFIANLDKSSQVSFAALGLAVGLLVTYFIVDRQQMEMSRVQMELTALKNQINPHFLFNNLNTLSNLIPLEAENAHNYLDKLAKFYRYIVSQREENLIPLAEELNGVQYYIGILKERFGDDLHISMDCENGKHKTIPPLSLQLLIENAIKHNAISDDKQLWINIFVTDNSTQLKIENNINERIHVLESTGMGLKNIHQRYQYFTKEKVQVQTIDNKFSVSLPLIEK